jgi:asparagine synthase (glutamine-hydrolysing)
MDQPTVDGLNTYFVSQAAAEAGLKVALSGLGADELFAGYPGFREIPRLTSIAAAVPGGGMLGRGVRRATARMFARTSSPKYASLLEYGRRVPDAYFLRRALFMPWELESVLPREEVEAGLAELRFLERLEETISGLRGDRARVSALEATWYMRHQLLRDADWASMSHSVEVRVPFVDVPLWRAVSSRAWRGGAGGAGGATKQLMARAPHPALPPAVLQRRKTGFGTPITRWIAAPAHGKPERGLRGWARRVFAAHTDAAA